MSLYQIFLWEVNFIQLSAIEKGEFGYLRGYNIQDLR